VDVPIPKRADSTQNAKHSKHHRKTKGDPLVLWLMVGSGVLLLAACIAVGAVILSPNKKPASKTPSREVIAPPSAADDKKGGPDEPSRQHEKRGAAGSAAANSQRGKARAADNKDKANGNMAADNNPDGPIPIPGLGPSKSVKP
jgi:hypothetical protein